MKSSDKLSECIKSGKIPIIAKPNSRKTELKEFDEDRAAFRVDVAAPPENNKANIELVKYFSKLTGKRATILSGKTGKHKIIAF